MARAVLSVGAEAWEGPACSFVGAGSQWQLGFRGPPGPLEAGKLPTSTEHNSRVLCFEDGRKNYCTSGLGTWEGLAEGHMPGQQGPRESLLWPEHWEFTSLLRVFQQDQPSPPPRLHVHLCVRRGTCAWVCRRGCAPRVRGPGLRWLCLPACDHRPQAAALQLLLMKGDSDGLFAH